jgi:hypothetical protein
LKDAWRASGEPATFVLIVTFAATGVAQTERIAPPDRGQHSRQGSAGANPIKGGRSAVRTR